MSPQPTIEHDEAADRFSLSLESEEALLMYRKRGDVLDLYSTYVPVRF